MDSNNESNNIFHHSPSWLDQAASIGPAVDGSQSYSPLDDSPQLQELVRRVRDQEAVRHARQQDLLRTTIERRNSEIAALTRGRDEEVAALTAEISGLHRQLSELQAEVASLKYVVKSADRSPDRRLRSPRAIHEAGAMASAGAAGPAPGHGHGQGQGPVPAAATADAAPVKMSEGPSIDVRMVYPGLEGIHLRPEAVQRRTFSDIEPYDPSLGTGSNHSNSLSPPNKLSRGASKEETLQVLHAPEERRLVINAGHTPNHSISHLPARDPAQQARAMAAAAAAAAVTATAIPVVAAADGAGKAPMGAEPELLPSDEVVLRGPLMLRNDREFDEAFLKEVKDRLELVRKSRDSSPGPSSPTTSDPIAVGTA